jgi:hypothetical protein
MIEKKIRYEEVKPSKPKNIKPVEQGGRLNYLGKQKTITAPVKWKSGPTHPETHLAYITKQEQDILVKLDLYKSMNGKPNKGPFGLPSLNDGDGSSGGDSGDGSSSSGSGGVGGSDAAGDAGESTGDSAGVGGSGAGADGTGAGQGPGGESGTGGVASGPSGIGGSEEGFGIGPNAAAEAAASNAANTGVSGAVNAVTGFARNTIANAINNPVATAIGIAMGPVAGLAARGISAAISAANRGVTGPSDDTQETASVQSNTQSPNSGGGIGTIQAYAPVYNPDTGNPTMDAYMRRLRVNLGLPV